MLKPAGMTSFDVVARVRHFTRVKRTGHGGTLDPMAEGVLPIAVGQACRLIDYLASDKQYYGEILLGRTTSTDDVEGETIEEREASHLTIEAIREKLPQFRGEIQQHPPMISAIKIGGRRMYNMVRNGNAPENTPVRTVFVHQLDEVDINPPVVSIRVSCGKGTYIRSIARDLGETLGVGGTLSKLVREKAGKFELKDSHTLETLESCAKAGTLATLFTDLSTALGVAKTELDEERIAELYFGRFIDIDAPTEGTTTTPSATPTVSTADSADLMFACRGSQYVGLMRRIEGLKYKPEVMFPDAKLPS